jgi:predicted chitinase
MAGTEAASAPRSCTRYVGDRYAGGRLAEYLRQVADGLKIDGRGSVQITLPEEYIRGESRVAVCAGAEGVEWPKFLSKYEDEARSSLRALVGDGSSCVIM